jgi:hypothetical protein
VKKSTSAFFGIFGIWSIFCIYVTFTEQSELYSESYEQAAVKFKAACISDGNKIGYKDTVLTSFLMCEEESGDRTMFKFDSPISLVGVSLAWIDKMTFGLVDKNYYQALLNKDLR